MNVALNGLLVVSLAGVDTAAGVRGELATGFAPTRPGDDAVPAMALEATPFFAVRERAHQVTLRARYFPRLFLREPNAADQTRILLLHQASFDNTWRLTPRLEWFALGTGAAGELDYTESLPGAAQTSRLPADVLNVARGDASGGFRYAYVRRQQASLRGFVEHVRPLGEETSAVLPEMTLYGVEIGNLTELNLRDELGIKASLERTLFSSPDSRWVSVRPELGWSRRLSRSSAFEASAGTVVAWEDERQRTITRPTGRFAIQGLLEHDRQRQLTGTASVALDAVFDPIRADLRPQAGIDAGLRWWIAPRWRAGVVISAYTAATSEPLVTGEPESYAALTVPFIHRLSRWAQVELGMRASARASHWASDSIVGEDAQLWAYSAITLVSGTGQPDWAW